MHRMAEGVEVETGSPLVAEDAADEIGASRTDYDPSEYGRDVLVYRISGAFFFAATATVSSVLDRIGAQPRTFILDFADVPLVDSTAAKSLEGFVRKLDRAGTRVYFTSARAGVRRTLLATGLRTPLVTYAPGIPDAVADARSQDGTP
jgi:SulP family sulfate permease